MRAAAQAHPSSRSTENKHWICAMSKQALPPRGLAAALFFLQAFHVVFAAELDCLAPFRYVSARGCVHLTFGQSELVADVFHIHTAPTFLELALPLDDAVRFARWPAPALKLTLRHSAVGG